MISILEVGCGTGQNISHLSQHTRWATQISEFAAVDPPLDLAHLPTHLKNVSISHKLNVYRSLDEVPKDDRFDLIISLDVLEHIEDDQNALVKWKEKLTQDGTLLIMVPAFQSLWSYHDEVLGHCRRYTLQSLKKIANSAGLKEERLSYLFSYLFPAAFVTRKLLPTKGKKKTALKPTWKPLNQFLCKIRKIEASIGGNSLMGTTAFGCFRNH